MHKELVGMPTFLWHTTCFARGKQRRVCVDIDFFVVYYVLFLVVSKTLDFLALIIDYGELVHLNVQARYTQKIVVYMGELYDHPVCI